jgi:uncharacterized protein YkwD
MVGKLRKSVIGAIILTAALAALIGPVGGEQPQLLLCQARQYPPPPSGAWTPVPPGNRATLHLRGVEELIWRLTNEIRQRYGIPPLRQDDRLSALARAYSEDMLRRRFFSHSNPEGLTAKDRVMPFYPRPIYRLGENIWMGSNFSAANSEALARSIVNSWMKSPGHRENILVVDFTHLGVGVAARGREIRATQIFVNLQHH